MNILITGSNGYLGSNLNNYLTKNKDFKIYTSTKYGNRKKDKFYFNLHENFDETFLILKKINLIIHSAFSFDFYNLEEGIKKNHTISKKLFLFAKKNNIKIIYISSVSALNTSKSQYGKIKSLIEKDAKKNNFIIIRPGLIYSKHNYGGLFGKIYKAIIYLPIIPIINKGKNTQYMCNIINLCELIERIVLSNNYNYKIIYALNQNPITLIEIIRRLTFNLKKRRVLIPIPAYFILAILKFFELLKINLGFKSDSVTSFLNSKELNKFIKNEFRVVFRDFRDDFKLNNKTYR